MYEQYINIIEHSTIKQIELTETNLNKIIKWIPTKFNEFTKQEAIKCIMDSAVKETNTQLTCGSKAEGAWNSGRTYTLIHLYNNSYLVCEYDSWNVEVYELVGHSITEEVSATQPSMVDAGKVDVFATPIKTKHDLYSQLFKLEDYE